MGVGSGTWGITVTTNAQIKPKTTIALNTQGEGLLTKPSRLGRESDHERKKTSPNELVNMRVISQKSLLTG